MATYPLRLGKLSARMALPSVADAVVCGGGLAGLSTAYHLVSKGVKNVVLVDRLPIMSLTSARSTAAYRNWWASPDGDNTMLKFINSSIDSLEEVAEMTGNIIDMNRRGYLFVSSDKERVHQYRQKATMAAEQGVGSLREHSSLSSSYQHYSAPLPLPSTAPKDGTDLLIGEEIIRHHFSYLNLESQVALHIRRCGWLDVEMLGRYWAGMVEQNGGAIIRAELKGVGKEQTSEGERVTSVDLLLDGSHSHKISTPNVILAGGPYAPELSSLLGEELPLKTELHARVLFPDIERLLPEEAPFTFLDDPAGKLSWPSELIDNMRKQYPERDIEKILGRNHPAGVHVRPFELSPLSPSRLSLSSSPTLCAIWTYETEYVPPLFPAKDRVDPLYGLICLGALGKLVPGMERYLKMEEVLGALDVDGGYYCKAQDQRPILGPFTRVKGAFAACGLSGFGVMGAAAAGELVAEHVNGTVQDSKFAEYATSLSPARFLDSEYLKKLEAADKLLGQM